MAKGGCSALSRRTSAVGQKADLRALMSGFRSIASATPRRADPALKARFRRLLVESGCGAVAVGSTYLFPPLSSGGASISEGFSHFVTSMTAPVCFRLEPWPGGTRSHWKSAALPRRTPVVDIGRAASSQAALMGV